MTAFTVKAASKKKDVDGKHGPMQVIALTFDDGTQAEWFTKASTPVPAPGSTLDGELEDGQYGKKFKKAFAGGGGGRGGQGLSKEEWAAKDKRIARAGVLQAVVAASTPPLGDKPAAVRVYVQDVNELVDALLASLDARAPHPGSGLGGGAVPPTAPSQPAAESSAATPADVGRRRTTSKKLNDLGVPDDTKIAIVRAFCGDTPTVEGLDAIDAAIANSDYAVLFDEQGIERPPFLPDTRDLVA